MSAKTNETDGIDKEDRAPSLVKRDRIAAAIWKRTVKELLMMKKADHLDEAILSNYCISYARALRLEKKLTAITDGIQITSKGVAIEHPYATQARAAWKDIRACADRLGLTPAARAKLDKDDDGGDSFFEN
jgi:P27 family predicted phage terminase small subunit